MVEVSKRSVSYTHLDVYKRQTVNRGRGVKRRESVQLNENESMPATSHYPKRPNRFKNENKPIPSTSSANCNKINTAMPKN